MDSYARPAQIEVSSVQRVLHKLRSGTVISSSNPLLHLWIVDDMLANLEHLAGKDARTYALSRILTDHITAGYSHQRHVVGLSQPDTHATLAEVQRAVKDDVQHQNPEMIGWSWLYYSYVRVDLNLDGGEFCAWTHLQTRTLRRYRRRALIRLTHRLMTAEQQARNRQR